MSHFKYTGIIFALVSSILGVSESAYADVRPRIVLGVIIDGLDSQYLDLLSDSFGEGGFKRLMKEGLIVCDADYGTNLDATAATSIIMTGASPSTTSVSGKYVYDRNTLRIVDAMSDPNIMGSSTNQTFSPKNLIVSTLSDEVRIASGGVGRVFSIAVEPSQAIIMSGHAGSAAIWLDEKTGNWAGSTYYKDMPTSIAYRNRLKPLSLRLDTIQWTPLKEKTAYVGLPDHLTHYPFRYTFGGGNPARYSVYASSPMINTEITDLAGELIDELKLGTLNVTDMVNVAYSLKPFNFTRNQDNRYELIDSYLRLDRDLDRLFEKAKEKAGSENTLIFVAATPPSGKQRRDDEKWNIPYGVFSTKKAKGLLNMYLIAKYGNGDWISSYYDDKFYLNHKLINDLNLDAAAIRADAAVFLEKMSGINRVYTIDEILGGRGDYRLEALQRNTPAASAGDLYIEVAPGWESIDDIHSPVSDARIKMVQRYEAPTAPIFIWSKDIENTKIDNPVDARRLAPTMARLLRIRSPNASTLSPFEIKLKK